MKIYHTALQQLASNYMKSVNRFCTKYSDLVSIIDKPNTHQILELSFHTIFCYNRIWYICELVFKSAHQPLKFDHSRNTFRNSHVYFIHMILTKEWLLRIWELWHIHVNKIETEDDRKHGLIGLIFLLAGEVFENYDWTTQFLTSNLAELRDYIYLIMKVTVEKRPKMVSFYYHVT